MSAAQPQPTSSVVTTVAVGRELKRLRRQRGDTQAQSAAAIGVSRANLTQWETGKYLPSAQNARQLDDYFQARNALVSLIDQARAAQGVSPAAIAEANIVVTNRSLRHVFQHVGHTLADLLIRDGQGKPLGWRHNQQQLDRHHTPVSTAYGIKTLLLVGEPYVDFGALAESLMAMRTDGGWLSRSGSVRSEVTATVVDALFRIGTSLSVDEALDLVENSIGEFTRNRPYLLTTILQTVVRLRPDAPLVARLVDDLLAARLDFDGVALWPENSESGLVLPTASTVHTARAVVALRDVLRCRGQRDDVDEAVGQATRWLTDRVHPDDLTVEQLVRPRPDGDGTTRVVIKHFTPAWVVRALVGAPEVQLPRLNRALDAIWARYDSRLGLWSWTNGDVPIWLTLDALTALHEAALTVTQQPPTSAEDNG